MRDLKDSNYLNLKKEFWALYEKYEEETLNLKEKIFGEANKKLKVYEEEIKEEFLDVWNKYGNPKIIFNNFKIYLDPQNNHNSSLVKTLTSNEDVLDLEKIARNFPEKEREHDKLNFNEEYKEIVRKMREILRNEGLHSSYSKIPKIIEFQKKFNILSFDPEYYK